LVAAIGLILFALLTTCADAFPLSGGNGVVNATVYGVTSENGNLYVDMSVTHSDPNPNEDDCLVELVDSEDQVHATNGGMNNIGDEEWSAVYNGSARETLAFSVPTDVIIKRLKITPKNSDPFSIDWHGVPEISSNGVTMKFYSGHRSRQPEYGSLLNANEYQWLFDIKLTNNRNTTLIFSTNGFNFADSNGWVYIASAAGAPVHQIKLSPNESLRFPITFNNVGEFSRPVLIGTTPEILGGVKMDIGAWV
jgi:hypothetical protein